MEAKVIQLALEGREVGVLEVVWEYLVHELRLTHLELQAVVHPTDDVLVAWGVQDGPQTLKERRGLGNNRQHRLRQGSGRETDSCDAESTIAV